MKDTVRMRGPEHIPKGSSKFTLTVVKKMGPNTFLLSEGQKWTLTQHLMGSWCLRMPTIIGQRRSKRTRNTPR